MNVREATALAAHVVGAKNGTALPILAYLRVSGGRIMASDLSQQIDIPLELPQSVRSADFCVHAGRLLRVLNALPPELELKLDHKNKCLTVEAGPTKYELNTLPGEDYPALANDSASLVQFEVPAKNFVAALKFAARAMATNDVRYYLNGVHFLLRGGKLRLTATDGHRLHRVRIELADAEVKDHAEGIIASASVARLIEVAERHVDVSIEASSARFNLIDRETLCTKLIDGKFPNADLVIPADRPSTGGLPRQSFLAAVRRVGQILAGDKMNGMRFIFSTDAVHLSAQNTERDKAQERFEWNAADKSFRGVDLGLAWDYVADALDALNGDWAFAHLPETAEQALFLTDGSDREVVIMPMRI